MLGNVNSPSVAALMELIDTQSKVTIARRTVDYAVKNILPIYERHNPNDNHPRNALNMARDCIDGKVKAAELKNIARTEFSGFAHNFDNAPVLLACARALIDCGVGVVWAPAKSLGFLWYGGAVIAYDRVGTGESDEVYDAIFEEVCADYSAALKAIAVENEPDPAKIKWEC